MAGVPLLGVASYFWGYPDHLSPGSDSDLDRRKENQAQSKGLTP